MSSYFNYTANIDKKLKKYIKNISNFKKVLYDHDTYIAGGFVLSAITDSFVSSDIDIYVNEKNFNSLLKNLNELDIYFALDKYDLYDKFNLFPDIIKNNNEQNCSNYSTAKNCNLILSSEYDHSFFKKNGIKFKIEGKFSTLKCDIMIVNNTKKILDVLSNFDLTCCQLWYNGRSFGGTHIKDSLKKKTFLNEDYIKALINNNLFIINRLDKYTRRGFTITIPSYKYKINKVEKKITNLDCYIVKAIINYYNLYFSNAIKCLKSIDNKTNQCKDRHLLVFETTYANTPSLLSYKLAKSTNKYKTTYDILIEYCNSFSNFTIQEVALNTYLYFGVNYKIALKHIYNIYKYVLMYPQGDIVKPTNTIMKKIVNKMEHILHNIKDDNKTIILRDHIKYIKEDFDLLIKNNPYQYYDGNIDVLKEGYDVIEMETKTIQKHIENPDNICFI